MESRRLYYATFLGAVCWYIYFNSLNGEFIWDDRAAVVRILPMNMPLLNLTHDVRWQMVMFTGPKILQSCCIMISGDKI